jgi:hypothetical protein
MEEDPIRYDAADSNLYRFEGSNPTISQDPLGLLSPKQHKRLFELTNKPRLTPKEQEELKTLLDQLGKELKDLNKSTLQPKSLEIISDALKAASQLGEKTHKVPEPITKQLEFLHHEVEIAIHGLEKLTENQYEKYKECRKYIKSPEDIEELKGTFGPSVREQLEIRYLIEQIVEQVGGSRPSHH